MKNAVSTSVKTSKFRKSSRNRFSSNCLYLAIPMLLTFGVFSDTQAQQMASINSPVTTEMNIWDRLDFARTLIANEYTVKGIVLDEDNLPLGGVNVILMGTKEGTVTDFDGTFEFPRTLEVGQTLVFSYLGYDSKEYKVVESASKLIEITIAFDSSDIILMGAVEVEGVYTSKRNIFQKFAGLFKK